MSVSISPQGQEIIKACELKVKLQNRAEELTCKAADLLYQLQQISNEQYTILEHMKDLDQKIEYLARTV